MEITIPPATEIKVENEEGTQFSAVISGERWSGIGPHSRFFKSIQKALDDGATITPFPTKNREEVLAAVIAAIDAITGKRIIAGFTWNDKLLSSSEAAQANFLAIEQARNRGAVAFPIPWSTLAGEGFFIANEAEWLSLLTAKDTHIFYTEKLVGQELRTAVSDMTLEQLNEWVDPR